MVGHDVLRVVLGGAGAVRVTRAPMCSACCSSRSSRRRQPLARRVSRTSTSTPRATAAATSSSTSSSSHRKIVSPRRRRAARITCSTAARRSAGSIDDSVGRHDCFGGSQDTESRPCAPPATSASVTSSIDTCGGSVVR